MKNSFRDLQIRFEDSLIQFLWDQWSALGMAGRRGRQSPIPFMIDPEALLLATTRFAKGETRFLVEVLDWLMENGKMIVSQRIKNLQVGYHCGSVPVLLEFDEILTRARPRDWSSVKSLKEGFKEKHLVRALPKDPELREMSGQPDPGLPENLIFTLRALWGGNARVETIAWLLTHERGHPAAIAREGGWFSKSVQPILNDLEASGMVYAEQREREKVFRLDHDRWLRWLRPDREGKARKDPVWLNQPALYLGCRHVAEILDALVAREEASDRMQAITIREGMATPIAGRSLSMVTAFDLAQLGSVFQGLSKLKGEELVERFYYDVEGLIAFLNREG